MNERKEMAKVLALILLVCADFAGIMHGIRPRGVVKGEDKMISTHGNHT